MTMDAYLDSLTRKPKPRRVPVMPAGLDLFDAEPETRSCDYPIIEKSRIEEVHESNASKHRADIERGKPIAVIVANRDGKVIAETFRHEATRRGVRFDSDTGDQRGLCWISTMCAVKENSRSASVRTGQPSRNTRRNSTTTR